MEKNEIKFALLETSGSIKIVSVNASAFNPYDHVGVHYGHSRLPYNNLCLIFDNLLEGDKNFLAGKLGDEHIHGDCIVIRYNPFTDEYISLSEDDIEYIYDTTNK